MSKARDLADGTFDTDTLVVDAGNNRVGVGTSLPASPLHIKVATDENVRFSGGSGDTRILALNDAASATTQLSLQGNPLLFRTTGGIEAARFNSSGNLVFPNGQGIDFSASEGSGATSSILDDYEEGTWTPSFSNGFSGTPTYVNQAGRYTKIGRMVYCDFYITVTGTGNSTQIQVDGLPFTSTSNTLSRGGGLSSYVDITANTFQFYGGININYFSCYINGSSAASISGSITGKYLIGIFTYETDA